MPKLPRIIFADENHASMMFELHLSVLVPHLKQLGYTTFYEESPASENLETRLKACEQGLKDAENIFTLYKELSLDTVTTTLLDRLDFKDFELGLSDELMSKININNLDDVRSLSIFIRYIRNWRLELYNNYVLMNPNAEKELQYIFFGGFDIDNKDFIENTVKPGIKSLLEFGFMMFLSSQSISCQVLIEFIKKLQENAIQFKGIDNGRTFDHNQRLSFYSNPFVGVADLEIDKSNKVMVDAYLNASDNFFARTGILHIKGMQDLLKTEEDDKNQFIFFHLHRRNMPISPSIQSLIEFKESDLPLGLIQIDIDDLTQDEFIKIIMKHINTKIASLEEDERSKLAHQKDNDGLTSLLKHNLSFFKQLENAYLEENRQHHPRLQHEYDKRFGLIPFNRRG